jgi:protein-S-isoprenylcysteine O-methyltransferase Ste14
MTGLLVAAYGIVAYLLFLVTSAYSVAFVGNLPLPVPLTVDAGPAAPAAQAVAIDLLLLALFAAQHSVMARSGFKRAWTRIVPPAIERSTYVLVASLTLAALMAFWRPIPQPVIWNIEGGWAAVALHAVFWGGWVVVVASTFLINHFELFGLQQVAARVFCLEAPAQQFRTPLLYRHVRHPLYLGFVIAFWATPKMTAGHLLFAAAATGYILVGIYFEERDLVALFGQRYRDYQRSVGMLLPWRRS